MTTTRRFDWLSAPQPADETLAELPAVERSALALSEIGGLDPRQIAARLGTDPAMVRKLLFRARESVRSGPVAALPFQSLYVPAHAAA